MLNVRLIMSTAIVAALGFVAPAYSQGPRAAAPMCTALPAGTTVTAADTDKGAAISVAAPGGVTAARAYAQRIADMYNHMATMQSGTPMSGSAGMGGMGGMHGRRMGMGGTPMHMVPSRASVENTAAGARIVLVPDDASQRTALRAQARQQANLMQQGDCPFRQQATK